MADSELQSFIKYMTSTWAILAGITAVFPLADVLLKIIPLPVDAYGQDTALVAIPITTLVSLFTLFYTFVERDKCQSITAVRSRFFFAYGLASLAAFLALAHFEQPLRMAYLPMLDSGDDYILLLIAVIPFYVSFFACVTRAFTTLALIEFKR